MIEKSIENDVHINELYILSHRHDNEINNSKTYKTELLNKSISPALYKNDNVAGFLDLLQPMVYHMIASNSMIRNWLNYTVSKYYDRYVN